jgi:hypothetical protein
MRLKTLITPCGRPDLRPRAYKSIGEEAVLGRDVNLFGRTGWYGHMEEDVVLGREGGMGGEMYEGRG